MKTITKFITLVILQLGTLCHAMGAHEETDKELKFELEKLPLESQSKIIEEIMLRAHNKAFTFKFEQLPAELQFQILKDVFLQTYKQAKSPEDLKLKVIELINKLTRAGDAFRSIIMTNSFKNFIKNLLDEPVSLSFLTPLSADELINFSVHKKHKKIS